MSERVKAFTRGFRHFWEKFESELNTPFSVIPGHTLNVNQFLNVILGFIPRIHVKSTPMDTRDRLSVTPEYDNRIRMCFKPEYDGERCLIKGLECIENAESGVAIPYAENQLLFSIKKI